MNGRIYDPTLGRFLQAEPHIQGPKNSQSYNRCSYVLNNPLSYTDPSGFFWNKIKKLAGLIVGAVLVAATGGAASIFVTSFWGAVGLGGITGAVGAAVNGGNILKGALTGAFSAAAFYGAGSAFSGGDFGSSGYLAKVAAHGTVGGVMSVLQGGKFGHGFAAAGLTQAFSRAIDSIGGAASSAWSNAANKIRRVVAAAVVGRTASAISGGKFSNGAVTGAFSRAFNDEMHAQAEKQSFWEHFKNRVMSGQVRDDIYTTLGAYAKGGAGLVGVAGGRLIMPFNPKIGGYMMADGVSIFLGAVSDLSNQIYGGNRNYDLLGLGF